MLSGKLFRRDRKGIIMEEIVEDLIPVREYDRLIKRIESSERLNAVLFYSMLLVAVFAIIAISANTYQFERRIHQTIEEFRDDVLALTSHQNIAIDDLNRIVLDRNWITFQRMSLEQLQGFCNLRDGEPMKVIVVGADNKKGAGGK
jgi:hypothetical protein